MSTETKKILIVEDERAIAHALELKLAHAGYQVSCAGDGEKGLELITKEPFALILLDLVMPKMDGFSVLEAMRQKNIVVPVLVLSNLSQEEDEKRVKELGAKGFFIKSNTPLANIVQTVNELLL